MKKWLILLCLLLVCEPMVRGATVTNAVTPVADTASNGAVYTTGAFTPAANDLLIVCVSGSAAANPGAPTITDGQSLGWTNLATKNSTANKFMTVWASNARAAASSMTVTATFPSAVTGCTMGVFRVSGIVLTGASALKQANTTGTGTAGGTPTSTFSSSVLTTNPTITFLTNGASASGGVTSPSGWTTQVDVAFSTPTSGTLISSRDNGFTGTTITWGSTTGTASTQIIVELDTTGAGGAAQGSFLPFIR